MAIKSIKEWNVGTVKAPAVKTVRPQRENESTDSWLNRQPEKADIEALELILKESMDEMAE